MPLISIDCIMGFSITFVAHRPSPNALICNRTNKFSELASTNEFITINFNEGVYSSDQGSGAINTTDFSLIFDPNGGNCTNANLTAITKIDGEELEGGESSAKFFLQLTCRK